MKLMGSLRKVTMVIAAVAAVCASSAARADINVGVVLMSTGPGATIGISSKNAIEMWPKTLGGQPAHYTFLDDATDPANTVRSVQRLINEDKVDVIVGPNLTAGIMAALPQVASSKTPMLTLTGSGVVVEPATDPRKRWAFKMAATDTMMADVLTRYMASHGVKTVGFIGYADGYGESWLNAFQNFAKVRKLQVVSVERYNRTDSSVTGQVLKTMAARPDAVLIAGAGTPTVLPQKTLRSSGFKGPIYQTHGIAMPEFLKIGGKDVEGTIFPTQPVVVAETLPANHPVRKTALDFVHAYNAKYGKDSVTQFAGDAAGAYPVLDAAVARALKKAKPGTVEFREALRDELEHTKEVVMPNGIVNTSVQDHTGLDQRSAVIGTIKNNRFVYLGQ